MVNSTHMDLQHIHITECWGQLFENVQKIYLQFHTKHFNRVPWSRGSILDSHAEGPGFDPRELQDFFSSVFKAFGNIFGPWANKAQGLLIKRCFQAFGDNNLTTKTAGGPRAARHFSKVVRAPECLSNLFIFLYDFCKISGVSKHFSVFVSSSMSIKLVNIFVWLLQHPWSVWRSQTLFWS